MDKYCYFRPLKIKVGAKGIGVSCLKNNDKKNENQIALISHFLFVWLHQRNTTQYIIGRDFGRRYIRMELNGY